MFDELNWYDKKNIINNLDWDKFQKTSINEFKRYYTIHDSELIDISSSSNHSIILVILWDPNWNDELGEYSTEYAQRWPILLLYFTKIKKLEIDYKLDNDWSFGISTMESRELNDNNLVETILNSHYGDIMKIIHFGEIKVMVFDKDEDLIELKKL